MNVRRFNIILKILQTNKTIKVQELMEKLNVSEATIRRDLNTLEKNGKIKRVHGGAVLNLSNEEDIISKKTIHSKAKERIGKLASQYIKDGDTIYLDAGTTTEALIKFLEYKKNIKVVTNGISHLEILNRYGIETYLLGGEAKFTTGATVGIGAIHSLRTYNIDIAFIGTNGVTKEGYSTPDTKEAMIKSEVVNRANQVYFLCDSSKFGKKFFVIFASLEDGKLITEGDIPNELTVQ